MSAQGEADMMRSQASANAQIPIYADILKEKPQAGVCNKRFPNVGSFIGMDPRRTRLYKEIDDRNISGNRNPRLQKSYQDITFDTCRLIEYKMLVQRNTNATNAKYLAAISASHTGGRLNTLLGDINNALQDQQNKLGWSNAIIVPAMAIMVETLPTIRNSTVGTSLSQTNLADSLVSAVDHEAFGAMSEYINDQQKWRNSENNLSDIGMLVGKFAYLTLPGARGIYAALEKNKDEAVYMADQLSESEGIKFTPNKADDKTYLFATSALYEWLIERMPIVVSVIAGIVAFIGYAWFDQKDFCVERI
jgi:hypothetical protein